MLRSTIVSLIILLFIWRLSQNFRQGKLGRLGYLLWLIVWLGVALIFWFPDIASRLALAVGIGRGADLVVYSAIIVILYLIYRLFIRLEKTQRDITAIVRDLALHEKERNDNRSDSHRQL